MIVENTPVEIVSAKTALTTHQRHGYFERKPVFTLPAFKPPPKLSECLEYFSFIFTIRVYG